MPNDGKICSFDCVYCEAGLNAQGAGKSGIPSRETVKKALNRKLKAMTEAGESLDVITFSGNGEPTLHPQFKDIVLDVMKLRDRFFPNAKVSVLSNSTMLKKDSVVEALKKVDNNILKLDSAFSPTLRAINQPTSKDVIPEGVIAHLKQFNGKCIVQTMFLRGEHNGVKIDNTTDAEINALIAAYKEIAPQEVMIYSIDRKTPVETLTKVEKDELEAIGKRIEAAGIKVVVS
jgi:wyosine [tRNA(Phe)-imidazoG37] synthetase (radical SAM superfamily)